MIRYIGYIRYIAIECTCEAKIQVFVIQSLLGSNPGTIFMQKLFYCEQSIVINLNIYISNISNHSNISNITDMINLYIILI